MKMVSFVIAAILSLYTVSTMTTRSDEKGRQDAVQALLAAYRPEAMVLELVQERDSNHSRMIVFLRRGQRCTVFVRPYMKPEEIKRTVSCLPAY